MAKVHQTIENGNNNAEKNKDNSLKNNELGYSAFYTESAKILAEMEFEKETDGNLKIKRPSNAVFDVLPLLLKTGVDTLKEQTDKEVFFYGALGCLSAIMPNVTGNYAGHTVYSNIYTYLLGNAGAGKGALEFARRLVLPVHQRQQELTDYKQNLILAANTSSTKAIRDLNDNGGEALFFETEGDTMANSFKSDTGDYSDTFRKGFHHEPISLSRITENLKIYIEKPRISAVLSSTFGQLLSLIPSVENGLFSRFLFHEIEPNDDWLNPFDRSKRAYEGVFDDLGNRFFDMHEDLKNGEKVVFDLQPHHEDFFNMAFAKWKRDTKALIGESSDFAKYDLNGTIHRLGLICYRLAMILTVIRSHETKTLNAKIVCSDADFYTAFRLVEIAKNNAIAVYTRLPKPRYINTEKANTLIERGEKYDKVIELYQAGVSLKDIASQVFGDEKKKSTVQWWISQFKKVSV